MKAITPMTFDGYLEDAMRMTTDGITYLDGKRNTFLLRLMHEQLSSLTEKLNETIAELNYQRNRRVYIEQALNEHGIVLPEPEVLRETLS